MTTAHTADGLGLGLGTGIGLGIPLVEKLEFNDALPLTHKLSSSFGNLGLGQPTQLRWPYSTRYRSTTFSGYDSSPTPSSSSVSSSSSESEYERMGGRGRSVGGSATHDVLLSYLSPTLSTGSSEGDGEEEGERVGMRKVYLLSSGLKQQHRRCKSETFKFPLPPKKGYPGKMGPLKSAMRSNSKDYGKKDGTVSPPLRSASGAFRAKHESWSQLSPQLEEETSDMIEEGKQGWSPYSSLAPTPRQVSASQRFSLLSTAASTTSSQLNSDTSLPSYTQAPPAYASPPSSTSSHTLVSEAETDSGTETDPTFTQDAAKLARLHASLFLLDNRVSELPLSLAQNAAFGDQDRGAIGGSVEEKMAYLCGLGYRYRRTSGRHARNGSGEKVWAQGQSANVASWRSDDEGNIREGEEEGEFGVKKGKVQSYAPNLVLHKAVRIVSNSASAVTSSQCSPILGGVLAAPSYREFGKEEAEEEGEGDITLKPSAFLPEPTSDGALLGGEFSYLVDESLLLPDEALEPKHSVEMAETGLMTPPLTTPELGLDGVSPLLLDRWPSPPRPAKAFTHAQSDQVKGMVQGVTGCRPFSTSSSVDPFTYVLSPRSKPQPCLSSSVSCPTALLNTAHLPTMAPKVEEESEEEDPVHIAKASRTTISPAASISVLTRPRPLRTSNSSNSLFSSASSDKLQKPTPTASILSRPRPIPLNGGESHTFSSKTSLHLRLIPRSRTVTSLETKQQMKCKQEVKVLLLGGMSKSASTTAMHVKVPQRKSSLDVRAEAELHRRAEQVKMEAKVVHPNSVSRDVELSKRYHSSASPYLRSSFEHIPRNNLGQEQICTSAASAAKARRYKNKEEEEEVMVVESGGGGMTKSFSLPVLFTARTAEQRAAGDRGVRMEKGAKRKSVVLVGPGEEEQGWVDPPKKGVLIICEEVTTVGLAL
ncbi:uncharacterized protein UTRI_03723 [Ustilago trichophora]|uniref:Uncharacterized protein n=1 Tax=Ustilago trichophora TaxID=86804 RepID=A0A5C3E2V3_9BASI|nr:uncharacterized protein UTRI_03723 [Ustilago trichophora]